MPSSSPFTFPQEICGIICQDPVLGRDDLHALCLVSRTFRDEAERLLYVAARVRGALKIKSFCVSLARRPHRALRMHKLMLWMPPQMDLEADDLSRIMNTLHLCLNLTDLHILEDASHGSKAGDAVQWWILDGHEFKLKRFVNTYFQSHMLVKFLRGQPTIEMLAIGGRGGAGIRGSLLPMLRDLDCPAAVVQELSTPSWYSSNLERLQFELVQSTDAEELATVVALSRFKDNLKSLSIMRREGQGGLDIMVLTACVAQQLPDIKYLRIMDYTARVSFAYFFPFQYYVTMLLLHQRETYHLPFFPFSMNLAKIQTLVVRPPTSALDDHDEHGDANLSSYIELRTAAGRRTAAERIMTSLSTLTRLVLVDKKVHEYARNLETGTIVHHLLPALDVHDWLLVH
ncbi:hypothetical protein M413DRAFT_324460 [Hebeloma cylindrosporum]|uniref:F-box domain-containing protein n=1 Tax=Hebeloma cylindrosporum TaxID=76867 RepID=A0A0C2XD99_HEBCY|nr:hypothetical protein M413DRAFT_324460 [Hebeloma cylindrosporum h7]